MKKITMLHIQLLPLLSGAQNMMINLLTSLDRNRYEIYVLSKPGGPLVDKLEELEFHHIPVRSLRRNISIPDFIAFFHIFKICKKYKFDIVHTHSSKTGFIGRIATRLAGIPRIIHTVHGFPFHRFQPRYVQKFYQMLERIASHFCDKVIFVNSSERELAITKKIVSPNKAQTIYNGIELPDIKKLRSPIIKNNFIIGSVLRFWEQKNVINTVKAAIKVCQDSSKINFVFIGDGELFMECQEIVNSAGMTSRILLPGWQNNILDWLIGFDIFLLFSRWEGLPISILEAMSVGLPIVASDIKGNNELVSEKNGILVSINDIDKLEDVLTSLPHKRKELSGWGKFSKDLVREKFNMKNFVLSYRRLYES